MSKAAVIGERSLVLGFKGAGFEIVHADDVRSASRALAALSRRTEIGLVLITEALAAEMPEEMKQFREVSAAILTSIPTHLGSRHLSLAEMRKTIEHAVGVDILR
ncbi:MAG TPA: V-type ATP synthase subunit F [Candidatus Hydrogenedentes bacterium]|nr:V-type ATP synthase subunit F [Candidatus Hydrogenedentota bacterium]